MHYQSSLQSVDKMPFKKSQYIMSTITEIGIEKMQTVVR